MSKSAASAQCAVPAVPAGRAERSPGGESHCDTQQGVIRVRVREFTQLFNSLDPAPFLERDLDDGLVDYIRSWAREIPRDRALRLEIHVSAPLREADDEQVLRTAVHNHFANAASLQRNAYRELMRQARRSLIVGLVVLAAATAASSLLESADERPVLRVLRESVIIGGWVAMWRPMELLLYDRWPVLRERQLYARLAEAQVEIVVDA